MRAAHYVLVLWLVFLIYWIVSWKRTKKTIYRSNRAWRVVFILAILILLEASKAYHFFFYLQIIQPTKTSEAAGVFLCAAGIAFAIWARHNLGRNWSANPSIKEGHELIETGPYRFVRHPIYTGMLVAILGTGFARGKMLDLFVFVFCSVGLYLKLRVEESLMMRQFPQAYPDYKRRTKALIPFVF